MSSSLNFRWLGVAGVEFEINHTTLLIDPYLTRLPMHKIFDRAGSDQTQINLNLRSAKAILITHSHWDHLYDVAEIARKFGSIVYGSQNTCQILKLQGLPSQQICPIKVGDQVHLPPYEIAVLSGDHVKTPLDHWLNAPLSPNLHNPIRPIDYHKDVVLSFHMTMGNLTLMHGTADVPVDILMTNPIQPDHFFQTRLKVINPRLVIPIHWDNFMLPLSKPLQPMFEPFQRQFPWLKRASLTGFKKKIETGCPGARVFIPELFTIYALNDIIQPS